MSTAKHKTEERIEQLERMVQQYTSDAHHAHCQLDYVRGMVRRLVHFTQGECAWNNEPPPTATEMRAQEKEVRQFNISYLSGTVNGWPEMNLLMEAVIELQEIANLRDATDRDA